MKLKNYLVLVFIIFFVKSIDEDDVAPVLCKTDIVESYKLDSYIEPREVNMYLCPKISHSCCSTYDQFGMIKNWQKRIKNKMHQYYESINILIKNLQTNLIELFKINITKLITDKQIPEKQKEKMTEVFLFIKEKNMPKLLKKLSILQIENAKFMLKNRSAFYCNICEFSNQEYINIQKKYLTLSIGSCREIANGTIPFSSVLVIEIIPDLMRLSKILTVISLTPSEKELKIHNFVAIFKDVGRCMNTVKRKSGNSAPCGRYCTHFKFNANSPVIEGDKDFLSKFATQTAKFVKDFKSRRILEQNKNLELENNTQNISNNLKNPSKTPNRILTSDQELNEFDFTRNDIEHIEDPYTESKKNPKFDEYMIGSMHNFQKNYEKEKQNGYLNFMKNKLHYLDIAYNFENNESEPIIKTKNHKIVDFENYNTLIDDNGMNVTKNMVNNFESSMKQLVGHIKETSLYRIKFENLDKKMVGMVNDIDDGYLKDFHRDNFLEFTNFGKDLKKQEILMNYDAFKKDSNKNGYNIKV